uniref:Uncharacterized protein n=1 Tax=Nelumbo nucifera TaxID=4432 RepID=A0A822YD99_NELNU|nr:TPA_asm: hypothetical protein HUJ06_030423 [Nelumbo nucifera]
MDGKNRCTIFLVTILLIAHVEAKIWSITSHLKGWAIAKKYYRMHRIIISK